MSMMVYIECADCGYRFGGWSLSGPKDKIVEIHPTCHCHRKLKQAREEEMKAKKSMPDSGA